MGSSSASSSRSRGKALLQGGNLRPAESDDTLLEEIARDLGGIEVSS